MTPDPASAETLKLLPESTLVLRFVRLVLATKGCGRKALHVLPFFEENLFFQKKIVDDSCIDKDRKKNSFLKK